MLTEFFIGHKRLGLIIGAVFFVLTGIGIFIGTSFPSQNSLIARAENQIELGQYTDALLTVKQLETLIKEDVKREQVVTTLLSDALDKKAEKYIQMRDFDEGIKQLQTFSEMFTDYKIEFAYDKISLLTSHKISELAYVDGMKLKDKEMYLEALQKFNQVVDYDAFNYENAQKEIEECNLILKDDYITKAEEAFVKKDYQTAIDNIESALSFMHDERAIELKKKCEAAIDEALDKAFDKMATYIGKKDDEVKKDFGEPTYCWAEGTCSYKPPIITVSYSSFISLSSVGLVYVAEKICFNPDYTLSNSRLTVRQLDRYFDKYGGRSGKNNTGSFYSFSRSGYKISIQGVEGGSIITGNEEVVSLGIEKIE